MGPSPTLHEEVSVGSAASALQALRREFEAKGWCRKATARILIELFVDLALAAAGAAVFLTSAHLVVRAAGMVLLVAGSTGVGTNTHTSSHYASSNKRWVNELLTYFGYPFFLGLSATFWWRQHVTVHHTSPNVIGVDADADLAPWLARTRDEIERSQGLARFYYQHLQWLALPLLLAMNGPNMQRQGCAHLLRCLQDPRRRQRKHTFDLLALLLHYLCLVILPALWLGWRPVIALYALWQVSMGYIMFAVLAPGHFPGEAVCRRERPDSSEYLFMQASATLNYRVGPVGRLLCSGLQYQIEHHLFPDICHVYYPKVSRMVREFCRRNDLPYRCYAWDAILWKCVAMFRHPPAIAQSWSAEASREVPMA